MDWYKKALEKKSINQKEFYAPYIYTGLSNDTLLGNPKILLKAVDEINKIRDYYLKFLFRKLRSELNYFLFEAGPNVPQMLYEEQTNIYSHNPDFADKLAEYNLYKTIVGDELYPKISNCTPQKCDLTATDKDNILKIFYDFSWSSNYGGKLWGQLAEYIIKLSDIGQISYGVNDRTIDELREAIVIIDVINSLEHNTAKVLSDLPQQEKKWLYYALEFLKNVSHPVVISDLIGDTKVSELYRREEFPLEDKRHFSTEEDRLYYNFSNLGKLQKRQVAQNTSNLDIIKMLIKVARGKAGVRDKAWPILFINLAKNPNIFKEDLYKELLENVKNYADNDGYTANGQDLVFRVLSILLDSPYAKEEDLDFIEDFKEDFDEGRS